MREFLGEFRRDLEFALRSLNKDRRFTLLAVLALALAIGSVTVIFSADYGIVRRVSVNCTLFPLAGACGMRAS